MSIQMKSNYQKFPFIPLKGTVYKGWQEITGILRNDYKRSGKKSFVVSIETYQGVYHNELMDGFKQVCPDHFISMENALLSEDRIREITFPDVTDDPNFGYMTRLQLSDWLDWEKVENIRQETARASGMILVYGYGASLAVEKPDVLIYADMSRWEIQRRQRLHEVNNIGIQDRNEEPARQYKRSFFVDWRVCDRQKKKLFDRADYWLDANLKGEPKMIRTSTMLEGLKQTVRRPFRVVPFFDPGPWGGHWMQEKFELNPDEKNFAWCFDCVPEENSLLFEINGELFEIPSINLVFYQSCELLGDPVVSRFGDEFPIRFDFLDTMNGGNLSLQVHPSTSYIQEQFGMKYTQDESYYLLDAGDDASVYLGLKKQVDPAQMISDLQKAQNGETVFETEKYVNCFPAKKHDHFLIPNGTVHCSGANSMVLEISATPFIFTFKLWDWNRPGMDGKPRPINIKHGENVIDWTRTTEWCRQNIVNRIEKIAEGDGWEEERTGLHENEFIETRRHWFTKSVIHHTGNTVNVLNLIEGEEAVIESPDNTFEPFVVHYAETFIVPAKVSRYSIRPYGKSEGKKCGTIKAYVRFKA
jgi:mannose-6-phosphate isomerase class I